MKLTIGKEGEQIVKNKLWQRGHNVRDVSFLGVQGLHFDFLVNDSIRVEVKTTLKVVQGRAIGIREGEFDVLALVVLEEKPRVYFATVEMLKECFSNTFSEKKSTNLALTEDKIKKYFTTNPTKLFRTFLQSKEQRSNKEKIIK